jgi:hypothetical protein
MDHKIDFGSGLKNLSYAIFWLAQTILKNANRKIILYRKQWVSYRNQR